jgi:hypothetical protein
MTHSRHGEAAMTDDESKADLRYWRRRLMGYGLQSSELAGFEAAVIRHMHDFLCRRLPVPPEVAHMLHGLADTMAANHHAEHSSGVSYAEAMKHCSKNELVDLVLDRLEAKLVYRNEDVPMQILREFWDEVYARGLSGAEQSRDNVVDINPSTRH